MASSTIPPQAYTREMLAQAYEWLKKQPESTKKLANTADNLVGLYLQAQRKASLHKASRGSSSRAHSPTNNRHSQLFKDELQVLAKGLDQFEMVPTDVKPSAIPGSHSLSEPAPSAPPQPSVMPASGGPALGLPTPNVPAPGMPAPGMPVPGAPVLDAVVPGGPALQIDALQSAQRNAQASSVLSPGYLPRPTHKTLPTPSSYPPPLPTSSVKKHQHQLPPHLSMSSQISQEFLKSPLTPPPSVHATASPTKEAPVSPANRTTSSMPPQHPSSLMEQQPPPYPPLDPVSQPYWAPPSPPAPPSPSPSFAATQGAQENFSQNMSSSTFESDLVTMTIGLDRRSLEILNDVQANMNLSCENEALRLLIALGYEKVRGMFTR